MIQFTGKEIEKIRKKAAKEPWSHAVEELKASAGRWQERPLRVPKTGIGNWTLYYYCPDCSVQLAFDEEKEKEHRCLVCGQIFRGEPYDGAWWGFMHMENYNTAFRLGQLYLLTGEAAYGRKAVDILKEYSRYYETYEVHGDIPYNGPGKACAQTLDEAILLRTFAMTCDLVGDLMDGQERKEIEEHLFKPGAYFLLDHRHRQIHNHEVIISSAIAVLGLLLGREEFVRQAVYEPYGLIYQLEHGMLEEGMWFEGSFGYHFFALTSFFAYEKFALHTKHSQIHHPNYKKMMEVLPPYLLPDGQIPMLNDTTYGHNESSLYLYEFAYREMKSPAMLQLLKLLYRKQERDNLEALLYGADEAELSGSRAWEPESDSFHTPVGTCGHTVLRGKQGRYLLFKHDTYGGEHDHYDRLGISYQAYGKPIAADLGTTGYGAVMHYDYYKNTGAHNTVMIGGENQAPAACELTRYEVVDGITYVEAVCDWTAPYEMPDSFTIVQWNEEAYQTVKMTRKLAWTKDWFAELFYMEGVEAPFTTDWVMHIGGSRQGGSTGEPVEDFSGEKPFSYLKQVTREKVCGQTLERFLDGTVHTDLYSYVPEGEVFMAAGPDNPSYLDLNYRIERRRGRHSLFLHVLETYTEEPSIGQVVFQESRTQGAHAAIEVRDQKGIHRIKF